MIVWFSYLKEHAEFLLLGAIFFAVTALLRFDKRRQLLHKAPFEESIVRAKRHVLLYNSLIGLFISLLLLTLSCIVQAYSPSGIASMFATILLYIVGVALLSGFLIAAERSKHRYLE